MFAKKKRFSWGKMIALLASLLLMVTAISGTLAFLVDKGDPVTNIFTPSKVTTKVVEEFNGTTKSNVKIQNTGDTTAWIRAAVVITWRDAEGNVYGQAPVEGTDYTISYSTTNWLKGDDGFYYYTKPVKSVAESSTECYTGVLIENCEPTSPSTAPDGYELCVEIICSGLQYKPASVFNENWASSGLKVSSDGTALTKTN